MKNFIFSRFIIVLVFAAASFIGINISFASDADIIIFRQKDNYGIIAKVKSDGTEYGEIGTFGGYKANAGAISPDGQWIYYVVGNGTIENVGDIRRVRADGSDDSLIADHVANYINAEGWLTFSPDGEWIFFRTISSGKIAKIRNDGSGYAEFNIILGTAYPTAGVVSPNGQWIYYSVGNGGIEHNGDIRKIRVDGTGDTLVADNLVLYTGEIWLAVAPADDYLYFSPRVAGKIGKVRTDGLNYAELSIILGTAKAMSGDVSTSGECLYYTVGNGGTEHNGDIRKIGVNGLEDTMIADNISLYYGEIWIALQHNYNQKPTVNITNPLNNQWTN